MMNCHGSKTCWLNCATECAFVQNDENDLVDVSGFFPLLGKSSIFTRFHLLNGAGGCYMKRHIFFIVVTGNTLVPNRH